MNRLTRLHGPLLAIALGAAITGFAGEAVPIEQAAKPSSGALWNQPADIRAENLYYGPRGQGHAPRGPFTFIDEDLDGTNPKFNVRDADGVKWKAKLGIEAQPETVTARLMWAVGYHANEDYLLPSVQIENLPPHLKRGQKERGPNGTFHNVRFKREMKGLEKAGEWDWKENPFEGTRDLNGLRVMMALVNNWDLKAANNYIYQIKGDSQTGTIYLVSDVGASFGSNGITASRKTSKNDLVAYQESKFITKTTDRYVDFGTPGAPTLLRLFIPTEYFSRMGMRSIGKRVPREDARWIGRLLGDLTDGQVRDVFRAGGYSQEQIDGFTVTLEDRIGRLGRL